MNLSRLDRVEFVMTWACTGRCKHCSLGVREDASEHVEYGRLKGMLAQLAGAYPIRSVMCFGGEPLLYPEEVCAIFEEARAAGIFRRQLITNGFFSRDTARIREVAEQLNECATEIALSVDAFHQESIPLEPVQVFAKYAKRVKVHPAWLVSETDDNPYNRKTREILAQFDLPVSSGNVVFPRGNALKYLAEYFPPELPAVSPYDETAESVTRIGINPNGDVKAAGQVIGNAYREGVLDILEGACATSS